LKRTLKRELKDVKPLTGKQMQLRSSYRGFSRDTRQSD
jgi:hypothetical protein